MLAILLLPALATRAAAQNFPSPVYQVVDAHHMDLTSRTMVPWSSSISVGPAGNALSFSLVYHPGQEGLTLVGSGNTVYGSYFGTSLDSGIFTNLFGSTVNVTVSFAGGSEVFNGPSGGPFANVNGGNSILTGSGSNYTYTAPDGTVVTFGAAPGHMYGSLTDAVIQSVAKLDGETLTYTYTTYTVPGDSITYARLQAVSSNKRTYQIHLTYSSGQTLPTKAIALDTAIDACSPTTNDCGILAHAWPTLAMATAFVAPTSTTYDVWSLSVTDANFMQTTYSLSNRILKSIMYPGPAVVQATGDPSSSVSVIDGAGIWQYAVGAQLTITDPNNSHRTIQYFSGASTDPRTGRITDDTDELGRNTHIDYDGQARIIKIVHPEGDSDNYTYDGRGNVIVYQKLPRSGFGESLTVKTDYPPACSGTNPDGSQITVDNCNQPLDSYIWDGTNQLKRTDYSYNPDGTTHTVTMPQNGWGTVRPVVTYAYASVSVPGGSVTRLMHTYQCNTPTLATCSGSPNELVTDICYGLPSSCAVATQQGAPTIVTSRAGDYSVSSTASMTYDFAGNVASVTSPLGQSAQFKYDAGRRKTWEVSPAVNNDGQNPATNFTYGNSGAVSSVRQGVAVNGDVVNAYQNDHTVSFGYDSPGNKTSEQAKDAAGNVLTLTQYSYDTLGRLKCTAVRMNPSAFGTQSDACQFTTQGAGGPDRIVISNYDAASQVTSVVQANGTSAQRTYVTTTYGADGETLSEADANGNVTNYDYDGIMRALRIKYPDYASNPNDYEQVGYDASGNLNTHRLRDGTALWASYDPQGRLNYDWDGSTLSYDNAGHVMSTTQYSPSHTVTMAYDALGRMISESTPNGGATTYAYDAAGGMTRLTWSDSQYVTYTRNPVTDQVTAIAQSGSSNLAAYCYDKFGRLTGQNSGPGASTICTSPSTSYGYDGISRLSSLTHNVPGQPQALGFTYNAAGQISSRSSSNSLYDWLPPVSATRTYANNNLNQVTNAAGNPISYLNPDGVTSRGNLTSDGVNTYSYSVMNQLTGYTNTSTGASATLTYDGLGRLWQTYSPSTTTLQFAYWGDQLVAEYEGNVIKRRHVPGPAGSDDPVVTYEGSDLSQPRWLHADNQGTVIAVTDASGALVDGRPYTYDEYGVPALTNTARFQYTGQLWIPEIGLYHYKARAYSPTLGRFMQADPIGYGSDMNMYAYVGGDPVNLNDPSGMAEDDLISELIVTGRCNWLCEFRKRPPPIPAIDFCSMFGIGCAPLALPTITPPPSGADGGGNGNANGKSPQTPLPDCNTTLPNGKTVGDAVRGSVAAANNAYDNAGSPYWGLIAGMAQTLIEARPYGPLDPKNLYRGKAPANALADAGNFEIGASMTPWLGSWGASAVEIAYATGSNLLGIKANKFMAPNGMDKSAYANLPRGIANAGCPARK